MAKKQRQTNDQIRRDLVKKIVEGITETSAPWRKPWMADPNAGMPMNMTSRKLYSGCNILLLMVEGYVSSAWGTYKQWKAKDCQVRKGEHGARVFYYNFWEKTEKDSDGNEKTRRIPFLKTFTVFNAEQVDGEYAESLLVKAEEMSETPDFAPAKALFDGLGVEIRYGGNEASHAPSTSVIRMPNRSQFDKEVDFWATMAHEHIHWGQRKCGFNGEYAMGELIAEMGACFILAELNLPQGEDLTNHQKYMKHWLDKIGSDPKYLFDAAKWASKIVDFLMGRSYAEVA